MQRMDDRPRAEEQARFEKRVRDDVEHAGGDRAGPDADEHVAEL